MSGGLKNLRRRDFLRLASLAGIGLAIPLVRLAAPALQGRQEFQRSKDSLGTVVTIKVDDPLSPEAAQAAISDSFAEIDRLESLLSRFIPGSPVSLLNLKSYIPRPAPEVVDVFRTATSFSELSEGSYDVTVLPALNLFLSFAGGANLPTDEQFEQAKKLIDFEKVDVSSSQVSLTASGMGVTLDCVGKGWILDRIANRLKERGIRSALVQGGGSFRAVGVRGDGAPWTIGILDPLNQVTTIGTVYLNDSAVTTSGDYENFFTADKKFYHIVDPGTARSPLYSHSATVTAPLAAQADPIGVASMVKSPQEALSMIESVKGCECMIVTRDRGIIKSSNFGRY